MDRENITRLSNEEVAAADAEARKAMAENQFVAICDDKKRVLAEIETLENKIKDNKSVLQKVLVDIENENKILIETKNSSVSEVNVLQQLKRERILFGKDFDNLKNSSESKKSQIISDVSSLEKGHEIKKAKFLSELKSFEDSKSLIIDEIKTKNVLLESLKKEEIDYLTKINILENSHKEVLSRNSASELDLVNINNQIVIERSNLSNLKLDSQKVSNEIIDKNNQIKELDSSIGKKNEEYKNLESKIFSITKRENVLVQKEVFIKSQYERAGVKWDT